MSDFIGKLKVKGKTDEDIFFAKRDRELIEALHKRRLHKVVKCENDAEKKIAKKYEKRFEKIANKNKKKPKRLLMACKELIAEIMERCSAKHK